MSDRCTPWLNANYFKRAMMKDKLKTLAARSNSKVLMEAYKRIRDQVNSLNIQLDSEYFSEKIMQYQGSLKKT